MTRFNLLSLTLLATALLLPACSDYRESVTEDPAVERAALHTNSQEAIAAFRASDPTMSKFFDHARGYAVFPTVGKGAIGIGGAYGKGVVYEGGQIVGYTTLSQATIGLQLGGQAYREIIFFKDDVSLSNFKNGNFEFSAQVSAVAATAGASENADFEGGLAVFTITKGGLMYEASVGGQKFSYESK